MVTARGIAMRKASEYQRNAEECQKRARYSRNPEYKKSLEQIAQAWTGSLKSVVGGNKDKNIWTDACRRGPVASQVA